MTAARPPGLDPDPRLARALASVALYRPRAAPDAAARERILAFLDAHPDALWRTCLAGHLTGSALLLDASGERCLLHRHKKLGKWLQFGGHADGDGNLRGVAWRETFEESGIAPEWIGEDPVDLDVHTIAAFTAAPGGLPAAPAAAEHLASVPPGPEPAPPWPEEPEHVHLDVRYLARASARAREQLSAESDELAWFTPDQALELGLDESLRRLIERAFG